MTLLKAALHYASIGWPVFPLHTIKDGVCTCRQGAACHSPGKHPRTENGFKDGTTDATVVKQWWKKMPDANIGLWCKGLIVVDVDPRNGGNQSLENLFATVADQHGFTTTTAITGGGGRHYIFKAPTELAYDSKPVPGIEIKSSGGLIVLAPSLHASGRRYEWEDETVPVEPAPPWLLNLIAKPAVVAEHPKFTGKPFEVERFLAKHHIATKPPKISRCNFGGYQWDIDGGCPFQPDYDGGAAAIGVTAAGAPWFGCFCGDHPAKRWPDFKALFEKNGHLTDHHAPPEAAVYEPPVEQDEEPILFTHWPQPLSEEAYHGPVGKLCRLLQPETESDPAALLFQALVMLGNMIGRSAHFKIGATEHYCNEFLAVVGSTGEGRKGTSLGEIEAALGPIDPHWKKHRYKDGGLTTGEGLVYHVRDESIEIKPFKKGGTPTEMVTDTGEPDKRLMIAEEEFHFTISKMNSAGNTLSSIIRKAWSGPPTLAPMTKNNRLIATKPHISIIAHITKTELRNGLNIVEASNGFINRFLWCCSKASRQLPFGGQPSPIAMAPIIYQIDEAVTWIRLHPREIQFESTAKQIFEDMYYKLRKTPPGLLGDILQRAIPHLRRLAVIYAVLDKSSVVTADHLAAAAELWRYSTDSAIFVFSELIDREAESNSVYKFLQKNNTGCTSRDILRAMYPRSTAKQLEFTLKQLLTAQLILAKTEKRTRQRCEYYYLADDSN